MSDDEFKLDVRETRLAYLRAVTRTALVLNQSIAGVTAEHLAESDASLMRRTSAMPNRQEMIRLSVDIVERELVYSEYANFFYGVTGVRPAETALGLRKLVHTASRAFVRLFRLGHQMPGYSSNDMGLVDPDDDATTDRNVDLATNYLIKNLWHNLVHAERQRINESNFQFFVGTARDSSDFMADNLAAIMLAITYGQPIRADSLEDPEESHGYGKPLIHLMRRNKCNRLFALRAQIRRDQVGEEPAEETVWRYRRAVAVYVSGWLLASGRAVATISVELGRKMANLRQGVVVEVNGFYCWTDTPRSMLMNERSDEERRTFRNHLQHVAMTVDQRYRAALAQDERRQRYAREALGAQLRCLGVEPPQSLLEAPDAPASRLAEVG